MKKSFIPKMLCVTTIFLALISLIIMLLGFVLMYQNSQKNNVYAQGDRYVSLLTLRYGIQGFQDLKTDRERSLYQTIMWMNDRCSTMVKFGYMHGRMFVHSGIALMTFTLLNGMICWKLRAWVKGFSAEGEGISPAKP